MNKLIFLVLFLCMQAFANQDGGLITDQTQEQVQTRAILRTDKHVELEEGTSFEARLIISPVQVNQLSLYKKKLTDSFLTDSFWVNKIKSINYSINNSEAIEASLVLIAAKELKDKDLSWDLDGKKIPLFIDSIEIIKIDLKNKEPVFMESYKQTKKVRLYLIGLFIILIIVFLFLRSKLKKKESLSSKDKVLALAKKASSRSDFELVFAKAKDAEKIEQEKIVSGTKFETILNKYQYKKKWSSEEFEEVKESLLETLC